MKEFEREKPLIGAEAELPSRGVLYRNAIEKPLEYLKNFLTTKLPLNLSKKRGEIIVLGKQDPSIDIDTVPIAVVANTQALVAYNDPLFVDAAFDTESAQMVKETAPHYALRMGMFTKPGDTLVIENNPTELENEVMRNMYTVMRESLTPFGIELTDTVTFVPSAEQWIVDNNRKKEQALAFFPNVLLPSHVASMGETLEQEEELFRALLPNIAAGTKEGMQLLCVENGIATPYTMYIDPRLSVRDRRRSVFRELEKEVFKDGVLGNPQKVKWFVVKSSFAGGIGVKMAERKNLKRVLEKFGNRRKLQVQKRIDLRQGANPCIIANLTDETVTAENIEKTIVMWTEQRIKDGSQHDGNVYDAEKELRPDIAAIVLQALTALQKAGVRGQINIDVLASRFKEGKQSCYIGEANTRPAGSSPLKRFLESTINGEAITKIRSGNIVIPEHLFFDTEGEQKTQRLLKLLQRHTPQGMTAAIFGAGKGDPGTIKASIAFCGTKQVKTWQLEQFERAIRTEINPDDETLTNGNQQQQPLRRRFSAA